MRGAGHVAAWCHSHWLVCFLSSIGSRPEVVMIHSAVFLLSEPIPSQTEAGIGNVETACVCERERGSKK